MLVEACEEVERDGENPEFDMAVSILTRRIGFMSPAENMTYEEWQDIVDACSRDASGVMKVNPEVKN